MMIKRWNVDVILSKLQNMTKYIGLLRSHAECDPEIYVKSLEKQAIVERSFHMLVEFASDLNAYFLLHSGYPPPENYPTSFLEVQKLGIIPKDLAQELATAAKLRNRLVHLYDEFDPGIVLQKIPKAIAEFTRYVEHILLYLDRDHAT